MQIAVTCSQCGKRFGAPPHLQGKRVKCSACGGVIEIPASGATQATAPQAPAPGQGLPPYPPGHAGSSYPGAAQYPGAPQYSSTPQYPGPPSYQPPPSYPQSPAGWGSPGGWSTPQRAPRRPQISKRQKSIFVWAAVAALGGAVLVAGMGALIWWGVSAYTASQTFSADVVAVPNFPEVAAGRKLSPSNVSVSFVDLSQVSGNSSSTPGAAMRMRVYLPPGDHPSRSLACVLVAPAGSNLMTGNDLDDDDYHDETLPYAEAGMAVVMYSLDGGLPANIESASEEDQGRAIVAAYRKFKAARAGLVNGRNAVEFVLAKLPQVDPDRIYCAGHSSAGTMSLLLAAHEPRIKACIAYAPAADVPDRLSDVLNDFQARAFLPGIQGFAHNSSPSSYVDKYRCPVFLFHARDDSNVPFSSSAEFADSLRSNNVAVTFSEAASGDHYDSMIEQGIPRGIAWLKQLPSEMGK